jgi:hypothetical protein
MHARVAEEEKKNGSLKNGHLTRSIIQIEFHFTIHAMEPTASCNL